MNRKLTKEELAKVQEEVNAIYLQFLQRVADGRKLTIERVNQLARGRVWTGSDALSIGLVDQLATLPEVIEFAKKSIKSEDADVIYYPLIKEDKFGSWIKLLEEENDEEEYVKINRNRLPDALLDSYQQLQKLEHKMGIQMRMPYDLNIRF
jgi:protease-4